MGTAGAFGAGASTVMPKRVLESQYAPPTIERAPAKNLRRDGFDLGGCLRGVVLELLPMGRISFWMTTLPELAGW